MSSVRSRNLLSAVLLTLMFIGLLRPAYAFTTGMAASLVIGQSNFTTNTQGPTQFLLDVPAGVGFDALGNLWVADETGNRVLMFKPPFSNNMAATSVIGQIDFVSSGTATPPTQKSLKIPRGLAFDASGDLWVSDQNNFRILMFKPAFSNGMAASLVIGHSNFVQGSFGGAANQTNLNTANGLGFDGSGNLWVADTNDNRILMFTPPFSNGMAASLVIGQTTFTGSSSGLTSTTLNNPFSVVFDALGNLWEVEQMNNRVMMFAGSTGLSGFLLQLQAGWNLISLPVVPTQTAIAKLLLPLIQLHELVIVWSFTPPATWSFFNPGPPTSGTLTTMVDGKGYWVNVKEAVNMTVVGYIIPPASSPPSYSLATGWNLVGFKPQPTIQNETVVNYLASLDSKYGSVWVFDNLNETWVKGTGSLPLAPGEGMWIYMNTPGTLLP